MFWIPWLSQAAMKQVKPTQDLLTSNQLHGYPCPVVHLGTSKYIGWFQHPSNGSLKLLTCWQLELEHQFDNLQSNAVTHLCDGENKIGGGDVRSECSFQSVSDDLGQQHADGLSQHHSFGFDSADTPAEHSQAVDHCCVRVSTNLSNKRTCVVTGVGRLYDNWNCNHV